MAGERFLVGVGIGQLFILPSLGVEILFELLFPGVVGLFVAVDFLFRRGLAGGRVSAIEVEINSFVISKCNFQKYSVLRAASE